MSESNKARLGLEEGQIGVSVLFKFVPSYRQQHDQVQQFYQWIQDEIKPN